MRKRKPWAVYLHTACPLGRSIHVRIRGCSSFQSFRLKLRLQNTGEWVRQIAAARPAVPGFVRVVCHRGVDVPCAASDRPLPAAGDPGVWKLLTTLG